MMATPVWRRCVLLAALAMGCLPFAVQAAQEASPATVYTDDHISVNAELEDLSGQIVHFGDVISLVFDISYDAGKVRVKQPDTTFFTNAWPQSRGPYLVDERLTRKSGSADGFDTIHAVYRFQILSCPDEKKVVCRGTRQYEAPEFTLEYQLVDADGNASGTETASFRPWPTALIITPAIPLGEEGELFLFSKYFPNGGYPQPLSGTDHAGLSLGLLGGGLVFLLGGVLMSPFGFMKKKSIGSKPAVRWQRVLQQLQSEEFQDDAHFHDEFRRCLVWYCNDELDIDPFDWLRRPEEAPDKGQEGTDEHAEIHQLFIDATHNPAGQGRELVERLVNLTEDKRSAQ